MFRYEEYYKNMRKRVCIMLTILAVSDSIGETAHQVAVAAASQFSEKIEVKRIPYVKALEDVEEVMSIATECENVIIVSTIITVNVREHLTQKAMEKNILVMNVLGPIINVASTILNTQPSYNPGAMRQTDEVYFKRIEAMEFAMQYDDSKDYRGLKNADVVLIGLSRTSKTPLCMYLANKGVKAINIPLMPEVGVPDEIYEIDKKKIFGLTINPLRLIEIRKKRLDKFHRITSDIEYAGDARVLEELDFADKIMRRIGCKTIDVTERAIEDTALIILEKINHNHNSK
jgi:regulator of PEP synthase PpsR (kinase-PPPase family)